MKTWQRNLLKALSLLFCTVPAALATLHYFPIWYRENQFEIVIPTIAVICFCLCSIPLIKWLAQKFRSPAAWIMWPTITIILYMVEKIISQMIIIGGIASIGNILGALLWKIACKGGNET